jgi:hypothetical protein
MKKFTRKFYNKKLVALGLSSFMGIGLISTGFAAWVMSKDANEAPEGNVNVSVITDASAEIKLNEPAKYDVTNKVWSIEDGFSFDALSTDNQGRIRFGGSGNGEDLKISFSGYLTGNEGIAYDLTAQVVLPEGVKNALAQGYIAWADGYDYQNTTKLELNDDKFTFSIAFVWGERFGGMNPSEYYDVHEEGKAKDDATMNQELNTFHDEISAGLTAKTVEETTENYSGTFKVVLSATPAAPHVG